MSVRLAIVGHVDHGKSTLIGRLLDETQQTREERRERVASFCRNSGRKFEYAFLLDALEEEQVQGITIDVTEVSWRHEGQEYVFVDTPGHREFLKKMVGGASRVDAAVILLDVNEPVGESFRRQLMVLDILGIKSRIILLNKMDLANWNESVWTKREQEVRGLIQTGLQDTVIIPAAAWHGANLLRPSIDMSWYQGSTFAQALAAIPQKRPAQEGPARFFVQDVYRSQEKRIYVGRVESGIIRVGDTLEFYPGQLKSRVRSVEVYDQSRDSAVAGDAIGITLEDPLFLDRGYLGFPPESPPRQAACVTGDIFWLDSKPLLTGERLNVKMGTRSAFAKVERIEHEIEGDTFLQREDSSSIALFGRVCFRFEEPWAFDRFEESEATARFVVTRRGFVLGGGRWVAAVSEAQHQILPSDSGLVLWLAGLSGAGKTTIARALEQRLKDQKKNVVVLDGDSLRQGLCRDLGFSREDRSENLRRASEVAKLFADAGFIVITAFITPLAEHRALARKIVGAERFFEIFVDCSLQLCESRDPKGLYAKARKGELPEFTGISAPFEAPIHPDLHLRTGDCSVDEALRALEKLLISKTPVPKESS